MELTLSVIIYSISILAAIHLLHFLQVKSYYWPRIKLTAKDWGYWAIFTGLPVKFPKKSIRNLFVFVVTTLLMGGYFGLAYSYYEGNILIAFLVLGYVLTKVVMLWLALGTEPLSEWSRERRIKKARELAMASSAKFVAITGSYGKSSIRHYLAQILSAKYKVTENMSNHNTDVGVSISILENLKKETEVFVMEVSIEYVGNIKKITSMFPVEASVLSGINVQHVGILGSRDNIILAKSEIIDVTKKGGSVYVNMDDSDVEELLSRGAYKEHKIVGYTAGSKDGSAYLVSHSDNGERTDFTVSYKGKEYKFNTSLPGRHSLQNLLPVIAIAFDMGLTRKQIDSKIKELRPLPHKLDTFIGLGNAEYIDDGYSSNIDGFMAAVEYLDRFDSEKKIVLTKGMLELGKLEKETYRELVERLEEYNLTYWTTNKTLYDLLPKERVRLLKDEAAILSLLRSKDGDDTTYLLEGRFNNNFMQQVRK